MLREATFFAVTDELTTAYLLRVHFPFRLILSSLILDRSFDPADHVARWAFVQASLASILIVLYDEQARSRHR